MKKKIFSCCIMLLLMLSSHASAVEPIEEWVKRYDSSTEDRPSALTVDSSGNVYVMGKVFPVAGIPEAWIILL